MLNVILLSVALLIAVCGLIYQYCRFIQIQSVFDARRIDVRPGTSYATAIHRALSDQDHVITNLREELAERIDAKEVLAQNNSALTAELSSVRMQMTAITTELAALRKDHATLFKSHESRSSELATLTNELQERSAECDGLRRQITGLGRENSNYVDKNNTLTKNNLVLSETLQKWRDYARKALKDTSPALAVPWRPRLDDLGDAITVE